MASAEDQSPTPAVCEECEQSDNLVDHRRHVLDHDKNLKLIKAAGLGHKDCVNACLAVGANVNTYLIVYKTRMDVDAVNPLLEAVKQGRIECVEVLIKAGADVNMAKSCGSILFWAINKCSDGNIPFSICFEMEHPDPVPAGNREKCVEILLQAGVQVTQDEIMTAAKLCQ